MASDRHLALRSSRKHAHWWCVMSHCSDPVRVEGRSCMRSSPLSWLLCSWVVMNIINGITLHVHLSHQVWPQRSECCGRGTPTYVACAECTQMCIVGKGLKGFKVSKLLRYAAVLTFNCIYLLFLYVYRRRTTMLQPTSLDLFSVFPICVWHCYLLSLLIL